MNLAPGSRLRPLYEKQPFYFHFLAYVFNVTNKDEVIQGSELNSQSNEFLHVFFSFLWISSSNSCFFVLSQEKPKLEEIGPYFFEWVKSTANLLSSWLQSFKFFLIKFQFLHASREWKEKFDMVDNEAEDSVTFHYKNTYVFRPDLSGNLTGDEIIVVPHPSKYARHYQWALKECTQFHLCVLFL